MLFYSQRSGTITRDDVVLVSGCYAGRDCTKVSPFVNGKNDPEWEFLHNCGPLPRGIYTPSPLHTIPHLGPCMALSPDPANQMFGRSGFFLHLDNPAHPGQSSDGCIVLPSHNELNAIEYWRAQGENQVTVTV